MSQRRGNSRVYPKVTKRYFVIWWIPTPGWAEKLNVLDARTVRVLGSPWVATFRSCLFRKAGFDLLRSQPVKTWVDQLQPNDFDLSCA